uniref:Uncharacterized protein n=1 Tax=Anguilla anguilla TaxID=7936 RepID=A0A0E9UIG0_ANGAN
MWRPNGRTNHRELISLLITLSG